MAVLADQDRFDLWADMMRKNTTSLAITKTQLRAAVDAIDTWFNDNATTLNSALPVAARNGLTTSQKAALLSFVIAKRYMAGA